MSEERRQGSKLYKITEDAGYVWLALGMQRDHEIIDNHPRKECHPVRLKVEDISMWEKAFRVLKGRSTG